MSERICFKCGKPRVGNGIFAMGSASPDICTCVRLIHDERIAQAQGLTPYWPPGVIGRAWGYLPRDEDIPPLVGGGE